MFEKIKDDQSVSINPSEGSAPLTDEQILLDYRRTADQRLFALLVRRYERELYNYLRRYLNSASMAEDAFQTTFLQVHLKCETFEEGRRFRPWLYTIATNQAIDLQRRNKRHQSISLNRKSRDDNSDLGVLMDLLVGEDHDPSDRLDAQDRAQWIREAVGRLPEPLLASVNLVYFQGMKYREAAEVLDVPVGTVKSRLHSALGKLRQAWKVRQPIPAYA